MIEILITIIICLFAGFIIFKSIKNSSKGKCNCDNCNHCSQNCTDDKNSSSNNIKIKK